MSLEPEAVFDGGVVQRFAAAVCKHVRPDLSQRALEKHHIRIVDRSPSPLSKLLHRLVQRIERIVDERQGGVKLKRLGELRSQ
jgi:hypothetical protein